VVDAERIARLLERLRGWVAELDRLAGLPEAELAGDRDRLASVKYHFIAAIECCIDLAHHVIAAERLRAPQDYADAFAALAEKGVSTQGTATALAQAARFRNRLVHLYWEVDDRLVIDYLRGERRVFLDFAAEIARFASG